jgi:hypothetical protein
MTPRHIPFPRLVDLVEGRLPSDAQEQVRVHVAACPRCAEQVAWLERVIGLMRTDDAEEPPPPVIAGALDLFRSRGAPEAPGLRQRLKAALRFDSARAPLAPGLRSEAPGERQLLFNAEGFDMDLRIRPAGGLWELAGQVLGSESGGQVELQGPAGTNQTDLNDMCEFRLPPVPPGSYTLTLRLATVDVEIIDLEVGT